MSRWKPRVVVAALIEREGQYLMVEERSPQGEVRFNQPAGHLEPQESLLEAVQREVLEETGWAFSAQFVLGVYRSDRPPLEDTFLRTTFIGQVADDLPQGPLDDGIIATRWMSREEIESRRQQMRSPIVLRTIDDYERGHRYPLSLLVEC